MSEVAVEQIGPCPMCRRGVKATQHMVSCACGYTRPLSLHLAYYREEAVEPKKPAPYDNLPPSTKIDSSQVSFNPLPPTKKQYSNPHLEHIDRAREQVRLLQANGQHVSPDTLKWLISELDRALYHEAELMKKNSTMDAKLSAIKKTIEWGS